MANRKKLELRMYFLVMRNISPIQQGIQCGHAQMEYALQYWKDPIFQDWAKNWKTWIILNGGTSNTQGYTKYNKEEYHGTMDKHYITLLANGIKCMPFYEPDLSNSLTAIAFVVDERVFNKEDYPDFIDYVKEFGFKEECDVPDTLEEMYPTAYKVWLKTINNNKEVAFLKTFLKQFKLA